MSEIPENFERRKSERIPQFFPVFASKDRSERLLQEQITGVTRDISSTGLSFLSDGEYTIGDTLYLQIDLPSSQHRFRAEVARIEILGDSKIIGAVFLNVSPAHQKALMDELALKQ